MLQVNKVGEEATVKLKRQSSVIACLARFGVFVDGQKVGSVSNGEEREFKVVPGSHCVYIKGALWAKSQTISLNLAPGNSKQLECGPVALFVLVAAGVLVPCVFLSQVLQQLELRLAITLLELVAGIALTIWSFQGGSVYFLKETG